MILAEKIALLRKRNEWSQEQLAEKLDISRQSVSKWESGASIPDMDKILKLSRLFEVSTDYLLKDEIVEENEKIPKAEEEYQPPEARSISVEEANIYMDLARKLSGFMAAGCALFLLCPVPLLVLGGLAEYGNLSISEDMAGGLGVVILLILAAAGVALVMRNSLPMGRYEFLEKEEICLQYGVAGVVGKRREEFAGRYRICMVAGVILCILSVVPLMLGAAFQVDELWLTTCCMGLLLMILSVAVAILVWAGCIQGSFEKLLQEGDYTPEKKALNKKTGFFPVAYWCVVTAIFLGIGLYVREQRNMGWGMAALIWPVAALIFVALNSIVRAVAAGGRK